MARARSRARPTPPARAAALPDKYYSKVVGKALAALDAVRSAREPVSLNELTLEIGLAKTSLFRILHTLEVSGYLERTPSGRYRAPEALRPLSAASTQADLVRAAQPLMKQINREFRETVSLAMRFENHVEVIATVESPQLIRMGNTVGRILPPHASSLGKAITALLPEDLRESLLLSYGLHRFTEHTIVDEVALKQELERVRKAGYSLDAEESALGGRCFGAPIRTANAAVVGAISLSMPKMRLTSDEQSRRILAALRAAAESVAAALARD